MVLEPRCLKKGNVLNFQDKVWGRFTEDWSRLPPRKAAVIVLKVE
jgi:hypothetical protein